MILFFIFGFVLVVVVKSSYSSQAPNSCPVDPKYITLTLYNKDIANGTSSFNATNLIVGERVFLLIHGWMDDSFHRWISAALNALLDKYPESNVIIVDYGKYSMDLIYIYSWCTAPNVGLDLAEKFQNLGLPTNLFVVIGFSLGAQIAGDLARDITKRNLPKIPLIIALDAAGVGYDPAKTPDFPYLLHTYLKSGDAGIVVGFYSSRESLGMKTIYGDTNVLINDGNNQGCLECVILILTEPVKPCLFCAHIFARETFIKAIPMAPEYTARQCVNFASYNSCSENPKYVIQALEPSAAQFNTYYIKVNKTHQPID